MLSEGKSRSGGAERSLALGGRREASPLVEDVIILDKVSNCSGRVRSTATSLPPVPTRSPDLTADTRFPVGSRTLQAGKMVKSKEGKG